MAVSDPREQKTLGAQVDPFRGSVWDRISTEFMQKGLELKVLSKKERGTWSVLVIMHFQFNQNEGVRTKLLDTNQAILAEASPWDTKWSIGNMKIYNFLTKNIFFTFLNLKAYHFNTRKLATSKLGGVKTGSECC
jgi:predicted NAD-dependent protein-ADP-ribosyltransferase YbiA (DUF1768 family)